MGHAPGFDDREPAVALTLALYVLEYDPRVHEGGDAHIALFESIAGRGKTRKKLCNLLSLQKIDEPGQHKFYVRL
jgi:hypothetical protein